MAVGTPGLDREWGNELVQGHSGRLNGVFYVGVEDGSFYAVSEATQTVLWSDFLGVDQPEPDGLCSPTPQGITATRAVAPDPVTGQ